MLNRLQDKSIELLLFGFIDEFDVSARDVVVAIKSAGDDLDNIDVRINSFGGDVMEGLAIFNFLHQHKASVHVFIDGVAASMGSVIAMAGDEITMPANAFMMIHNVTAGAFGEIDDIEKRLNQMRKVTTAIANIYSNKTDIPVDEILDLMEDETWMNGVEALEMGFATEVIDDVEIEACIDESLFLNTPINLIHLTTKTVPSEEIIMPENKKVEETKPDQAQPAKPVVDLALQKRIDDLTATQKTLADRLNAGDRLTAMGKTFKAHMAIDGAEKLLNDCLTDEGCTIENAQERLLDFLGKKEQPHIGHTIQVIQDASDKFVEGVGLALELRCGLLKGEEKKRAMGSQFQSFTLLEIARENNRLHNIHLDDNTQRGVISNAFTHTTSDYPSILENIANKSMMRGYEEADETYQLWVSMGVLTDFKVSTRVDLNTYPTIPLVPEGAEFKAATIGERREPIQILTYGGLFSMTRQLVINDDLDALSRVPRRMGRASNRLVGDLVYAQLIQGESILLEDGTAIFDATRNNLVSPGTAPSTASLEDMRVRMGTQSDRDNNAVALAIKPKYIISGLSTGGQIRKVLKSETEITDTQQPNANVPNIVTGIVDPIEDNRITGTEYFMAADGNMTDTVEIQWLNGVQEPFLDSELGFTVDGINWKIRLDLGVKTLAFEGLVKNPGM